MASKPTSGAGGGALRDDLQISLYHSFGFRTLLRDPVLYVRENRVVHAVGRHVVVANLEQRTSEFIDLAPGVQDVLAIAASPFEGTASPFVKHIALCEQVRAADGSGTGNAQVSVYKLPQRTRLNTITYQSPQDFSCAAFSGDGTFLATHTAHPDNHIMLWRWQGEKLLAHERAKSTATRVRFNPTNNAMVTTSGPGHLRCWRVQLDGSMKSAQLVRKGEEDKHWVDHIWVGDSLVAVTADGRVRVLRQPPQRDDEAQAPTSGVIALLRAVGAGANHKVPEVVQRLTVQLPEGGRVEGLTAHGKGFVVVGTQSLLAVFAAQEDPTDPFIATRTFLPTRAGADGITYTHVTAAPGADTLAITTRTQRFFDCVSFPIGGYDALDTAADHCRPLLPHTVAPGPTGRMTSLATCRMRPIVVSVGDDATVRVWDYVTLSCEASVSLPEEPAALALHPTGFLLLLGFKDRLQLRNVEHNALSIVREAPIKHCKALEFANGGHVFAAAFGITVSVFSAYDFSPVVTFTGHIGSVRRFTWTQDDHVLVSAGEDGAVYGWSIPEERRLDDISHVSKGTKHTGVAVADDARCVVVASSDAKLREIAQGTTTANVFPTGSVPITHLLLSRTGTTRYLFAGSADGSVRAYPWPLRSGAYVEVVAHRAPVRHMALSADERVLLTCGEDGAVFAVSLRRVDRGRPVPWDPPQRSDYNFSPVLIAREEVRGMGEHVDELKKRVDAERSEREVEAQFAAQRFKEDIERHAMESEAALEAERAKIRELTEGYESYYKKAQSEQRKTEKEHAEDRQRLINGHEHRWALEMERFDKLSEQMERLEQRCAEELRAQAERHEAAMEQHRGRAKREKEALQRRVKQLDEDLRYNREKYAEVLQQQEEMYEQELRDHKEESTGRIEAEHEETALYKSKLNTEQDRTNTLRNQVKEAAALADEARGEKEAAEARAKKLEEAHAHLSRHLDEREQSLAEKDRALLQLRSENRTLRNFRFVLQHHIDTMRAEKGPITQHIDRLERHVRDMYGELVKEFSEKKSADAELRRAVLRSDGLTSEVDALRVTVRRREATLATVSHELSQLVQYTDLRDIEDGVKRMYRVHVKGENPAMVKRSKARARSDRASAQVDRGDKGPSAKPAMDSDGGPQPAQQESDSQVVKDVVRQRDYMERKVAVMKRALGRSEEKLRLKQRQTVVENSALISECNHLRRENKLHMQRQHQLAERVRSLQRRLESAGMATGPAPDSPATLMLPPTPAPATAAGSAAGSGVTAGRSLARRADTAPHGPRQSARGRVTAGASPHMRTSAPSPIRAGPSVGGLRSSASAGRLMRGATTSRLGRSATARQRVEGMASAVGENDARLRAQEEEIVRLREQVQMLAEQVGGSDEEGGAGSGVKRPGLRDVPSRATVRTAVTFGSGIESKAEADGTVSLPHLHSER